jgi:ATP/maltotriose-dependent transcriptional regulator MalT
MPRRIACSAALTAREREVLSLLAANRLNKRIVGELGIRFSMVRSHLESIYAKLGVLFPRSQSPLWERGESLLRLRYCADRPAIV